MQMIRMTVPLGISRYNFKLEAYFHLNRCWSRWSGIPTRGTIFQVAFCVLIPPQWESEICELQAVDQLSLLSCCSYSNTLFLWNNWDFDYLAISLPYSIYCDLPYMCWNIIGHRVAARIAPCGKWRRSCSRPTFRTTSRWVLKTVTSTELYL